MIKIVLKYLLYFVIFSFCVTLFFPKLNLYYLGVEKLSAQKIDIVPQDIEEKSFSLIFSNAHIKYQNINILEVENINITTYILYNKIILNNIQADETIKKLLPVIIDDIDARYSILNPLVVDFNLYFKGGKGFGEVKLLENKVVLYLELSSRLVREHSSIMKKFKKEGQYYKYEYKYRF